MGAIFISEPISTKNDTCISDLYLVYFAKCRCLRGHATAKGE